MITAPFVGSRRDGRRSPYVSYVENGIIITVRKIVGIVFDRIYTEYNTKHYAMKSLEKPTILSMSSEGGIALNFNFEPSLYFLKFVIKISHRRMHSR